MDQPITLIIPLERRNEEVKTLVQIRAGERIDHFETMRLRKDGTLIELSLTISPVKDGGGRIIGASKVARDISRSKQIERALRESEERLRALSDSLVGVNPSVETVSNWHSCGWLSCSYIVS